MQGNNAALCDIPRSASERCKSRQMNQCGPNVRNNKPQCSAWPQETRSRGLRWREGPGSRSLRVSTGSAEAGVNWPHLASVHCSTTLILDQIGSEWETFCPLASVHLQQRGSLHTALSLSGCPRHQPAIDMQWGWSSRLRCQESTLGSFSRVANTPPLIAQVQNHPSLCANAHNGAALPGCLPVAQVCLLLGAFFYFLSSLPCWPSGT